MLSFPLPHVGMFYYQSANSMSLELSIHQIWIFMKFKEIILIERLWDCWLLLMTLMVDIVTNLGKFFAQKSIWQETRAGAPLAASKANLVATTRPLSLPNTVLRRTKGDTLLYFYVLRLLSSLSSEWVAARTASNGLENAARPPQTPQTPPPLDLVLGRKELSIWFILGCFGF